MMPAHNMSVSDLMQMAEHWRQQARLTCAKMYLNVIAKKRWAKHCLKQAKLYHALYEQKAADPSLILP
jgi:hypothetical protein